MHAPPDRKAFPRGTEFHSVSGTPVAVWPGAHMAVTFNGDGPRGYSAQAVRSSGSTALPFEDWIARFWP